MSFIFSGRVRNENGNDRGLTFFFFFYFFFPI